jgi:hypothetical protein
MKKRLFILLIILLAKSNVTAQDIVFLDQNLDGTPYLSTHPVILTSNLTSVTISGDIQHEVSTNITPTSDNVILIRASEAIFGVNPTGGGSKGTIIRPKPGFCLTCNKNNAVKPIDVFLNQVNNDIQITSQEGIIVGFTVYDLTGKALSSEKTAPTSNCSITTTELRKGIYIVRIDLENQQFKTMKFIKN